MNCGWTPTPNGSPKPGTPRWCSTTGSGVHPAGEPRRILDIKAQQADWSAAIAYARHLDGVDNTRVVGWGSSFGGGHVLVLASHDHDLAAAIVQVPHVTGPASAFAQSPKLVSRLILAGLRDQVGDWLGRPPYRVAAIGRPGDVAMMTSPGAADLVERMAGTGARNCSPRTTSPPASPCGCRLLSGTQRRQHHRASTGAARKT